MITIKNIFDKNIKTFKERSENVQRNLEFSLVEDEIRKNLSRGEVTEDTQIGKYLDSVANYLLASDDVPSGRKAKDSHYRNEKDYRNNYSIGRNTIADTEKVVDFSDDLVEREQFIDRKGYIKRLFDPKNLTIDVLRDFIVNWGNYTQVETEELREAIKWLQMEIRECVTEDEWKLIKKFEKFHTMTEVALNMGISQPAVSKKIKKICQKIQKVVIPN